MNFRVTDSGMTAFHAAVEGGKIDVLKVRESVYFVIVTSTCVVPSLEGLYILIHTSWEGPWSPLSLTSTWIDIPQDYLLLNVPTTKQGPKNVASLAVKLTSRP